MTSPKITLCVLSFAAAIASMATSNGQTLPDTFGFTVAGRFQNAVSESSNSVIVIDNNLTNGYNSRLDLHQAPSDLQTGGPAGSAMFQWGTAATSEAYPHPSALWFQPLGVSNVSADEVFQIGYLYYRNGTIVSGTGASSIDLHLTFTIPGGETITTTYTSNLINTPNTGTAAEQADIVSLTKVTTPLSYKDSEGNTYYLELAFQIDDDTRLNSLSNSTEFRVYEGSVGRAEMVARITTTPGGFAVIPEPSSLLLGVASSFFFLRRKRHA